MSGSVLKFVRGADLSGTNYAGKKFPNDIDQLSNIRWIRLNKTGLDSLPSAVNRLQRLEYLSLQKNELLCIPPSVKQLKNLQTLRCSYNTLSQEDISADLYALDDLTTLDLSHNRLSEIPEELAKADSLLVLSLSHNKITSIPHVILVHLTELQHLDLSYNRLESIPPQLRRLASLTTLILSGNPLNNDKLKSLFSLEELTHLELRDTGRTLSNIPPEFADLANLTDLDLSSNQLTSIPPTLFLLSKLKRLNISENQLRTLPDDITSWGKLESLSLSRNHLTELPASMGQLHTLRRLIVNHNNIKALPREIGHLTALEHLHVASNGLTGIPLELCSCVRLRVLNLQDNAIAALPVQIHRLNQLVDGGLQLKGNPRVVIPAKPPPAPEPEAQSYFINFDQYGGALGGGSGCATPSPLSRQRIGDSPFQSRMGSGLNLTDKFRRGNSGPGSSSSLVPSAHKGSAESEKLLLQGLNRLANAKEDAMDGSPAVSSAPLNSGGESIGDTVGGTADPLLHPKRWKDNLKGPSMDAANIFPGAGSRAGVLLWRMQNFYPVEVDELEFGKFYTGDCYIVLETFLTVSKDLDHRIFFWIGAESSLDKKASAAIHAVNLRNYLKVQQPNTREEQDEESQQFTRLFDHKISYIEGGTDSGFYETKAEVRPVRLFLLKGQGSLRATAVPLSPTWLSSQDTFLLDVDQKNVMYIWQGRDVGSVTVKKALLFAEKAAKLAEKVGKTVEIVHVKQDSEPLIFWRLMGLKDAPKPNTIGVDFVVSTHKARLMEMRMGEGFLELPQVIPAGKDISQSMLKTTGVYILDDYDDLFVWVGKKSSRLVRAAAQRVAMELQKVMPRPSHFMVSRVVEGNEHQMFKSKFRNWDEVIQADYRARDIVAVEQSTATPETSKLKRINQSLKRRSLLGPSGSLLSPLGTPSKMDFFVAATPTPKKSAPLPLATTIVPPRIEVGDLFSTAQSSLSEEEARACEDIWTDELENVEAFVLQGTSFAKLPKDRQGHLYSEDCYVYLVTQWRVVERTRAKGASGDDEEEEEEEMECIAYFWEGRDAKKLGWLNFNFHTKRQMETLIRQKRGCELQVKREYQQRESMRFLTLFNHQTVIHKGSYKDEHEKREPKLFCLHAWKPKTFTRMIEVQFDTRQLNSNDCFLLKVPFDGKDDKGIVYVWIGNRADEEDVFNAQEIGRHKIWGQSYSVQTVREGSAPRNFFWSAFGDVPDTTKAYDPTFPNINNARFFECSNLTGHFTAIEKRPDFCQDDLDDNIVAIIDTTRHVFVWIGPFASDVVQKLAWKSAVEYCNRLPASRECAGPVKVLKGQETFDFTRVFHGWATHRADSKDLAKPFEFLGRVTDASYQRAFELALPKETAAIPFSLGTKILGPPKTPTGKKASASTSRATPVDAKGKDDVEDAEGSGSEEEEEDEEGEEESPYEEEDEC